MSRYWNHTKTYSQLTVNELQKKANESVKNASKKGKKYEPIVVHTREIVQSWWGKAWCQNIEKYADYQSRIGRGKHYIKSGAVIDLKIQNSKITSRVQGNRRTPYKVTIHISRLNEEKCQKIISQCGKKIQNLEQLINGEFPDELQELFLGENGLFPTPQEITYQCSCPDWALMCKHVAATLYAVGVRFDENPFLFFELRGIDVHRFIDVTLKSKVEDMIEHSTQHTSRMIEEKDIHNIFGI